MVCFIVDQPIWKGVMNFWAVSMTSLGFLVWMLIFYQKIRTIKIKQNILISLGFFATCVTINSPKIYVFLDQIVGGKNFMYLLVQLTFLAAIHFVWVAVQPDKVSLAKKVSAFSSVLIIVGFYFANLPYTSVRVEDFRTQAAVIFFTQILNVHSAAVAVFIMKKINIFIKKAHKLLTKLYLRAVFYGFGVGITTVFVRIAIDISATRNDALNNILVQADALLVFVASILVCGGLGFFGVQNKVLRKV